MVSGEHRGRDWRPAPVPLTACQIVGPGVPADYRCAGTMLTGNFITSIRLRAFGASADRLTPLAAVSAPARAPGPWLPLAPRLRASAFQDRERSQDRRARPSPECRVLRSPRRRRH